jgi:hypothetical protein
MWTMSLRSCARYTVVAFVVTLVIGATAHDAVAKPHACGTQTCSADPKNQNCQVCKSAVCETNDKGQEYLVPGTATTKSCTEPAKIETPPPAPPSKGAKTKALGGRLAR